MKQISAAWDSITRRQCRIVPAVSILVVTLITWLPLLRNGFVTWDDDEYIIENVFIRNLDWPLLRWSFTEFVQGNWHPLTNISHALDYALWGLDPFGHHLSSLILHLANTLLVFLLVTAVLAHREGLSGRFTTVAAAVTALLFGIHPLHVESVAWAAERKDLLCGLFYLLAILAYLRRACPAGTTAGFAAVPGSRLLPAFIFTLLALMSKPMAVTLPLVLLLIDRYLLDRIDSARTLLSALREKIPFLLVSLFVATVTIIGQHKGILIAPVEPVPLFGRLLVATRAFFTYLLNMLFPAGLLPIYPYPPADEITVLSWQYLLPLAAAAVLVILFFKGVRRGGWRQALWLYYLVTLLPVIGIVQVGHQFMADRYSYLPALGPFMAAGISAGWLWDRYAQTVQLRSLLSILALSAAALLSYLTTQQIALWRDSVTFWTHIIAREPVRVPFAYINRGSAYREANELDKAAADLDRAVALLPTDFNAYNSRGLVYAALGEHERAIADFERAIQLFPGDPAAYYNRGAVFRKKGDPDRALADYNTALAMKPSDLKALNNRGLLLQERGQYEAAMADFNMALSFSPADWMALNNRGLLFSAAGDTESALADFNRAVRITPDEASIYLNRGTVLRSKGDEKAAFRDFNRAVHLKPADSRGYNNRALIHTQRGDLPAALRDLTRAIELEPSLAALYLNRGIVRMKSGDDAAAGSDFVKACELGEPRGCTLSGKAQ